MRYFPQLYTGSIGQFPITRRTVLRTITNELLDGNSLRMADSDSGVVRWQLQYASLTEQEWSCLEELFVAVEGRLNTFTFLDPADNLLMWSEDWTRPSWSADPLLQFSSGLEDPLGGTNSMQITNAAQATQRVAQAINAPSWLQYCFSVYLRSEVSATAQLLIATMDHEFLLTVPVGATWKRAVAAAALPSQVIGISFGLQLESGVSIQAFGAQVEAQPAPGPYKRTTDRCGYYSTARFDFDSLQRTTDAPNQNSCVVNLVCKPA